MSEEIPEQPQAAAAGVPDVKTGDWLKEAFELYKSNFWLLFGAALIAGIISLTIVLAGAMSVGLFLIVLRLLDGSEPRPSVGDVFKGFSALLPALLFVIGYVAIYTLASLILGSVPGIGGILSTLGSLAIGTLLMFGIPLIADKGLDPIPAAKLSAETVMKNFFGYLVFNIVASIAGGCGVILFGIGVFFTIPLYLVSIGVAYRKTF